MGVYFPSNFNELKNDGHKGQGLDIFFITYL